MKIATRRSFVVLGLFLFLPAGGLGWFGYNRKDIQMTAMMSPTVYAAHAPWAAHGDDPRSPYAHVSPLQLVLDDAKTKGEPIPWYIEGIITLLIHAKMFAWLFGGVGVASLVGAAAMRKKG